jgi:hypothetical protein
LTAEVVYLLDGALEKTQTAVKPNLNPEALGLTEAWAFTAGRLMAPEDLSLGSHTHTLRVVITDFTGVVADSQITFFVDAAETGACL